MCNTLTLFFFLHIFSMLVCLMYLTLVDNDYNKNSNYPTIASCDACNPCYIKLTTMKFGIQTPS